MHKFKSLLAEKWNLYFTITLIGTYALLPFLFLNLYNHPATDDYFFAVRDTKLSFWESQVFYFFNHSGRFFATAIVRINPLIYNSFLAYKIYSLYFIILFIGSLWLLLHQLLKKYFTISRILALLALLICIYFMQMPNIPQGIYWFTGYMGFQMPNVLFLIFLFYISKFHNSNKKQEYKFYSSISFLLAAAIIGSNEMSLIVLMSFLLFYLVTQWQLPKLKRNYLLTLFIICLIISLVVVLAPGNYIRMGKERSSVSFIEASLGSIVFTIVSLYKWGIILLVMSFIYTFLWGIHIANQIKNNSIFNVPLFMVVVWFISTIFLMNFVYTWSAGERAVTRVENVIYFFFVFGWMYILQFIINKYLVGERGKVLLTFKIIPKALTVVFCLLLFDVNNNITTAYLDLLSGRAAQFDKELNERYAYLKYNTCNKCIIEPISILPKSLYIHHMLPVEELDEMGIRGKFIEYWGKSSITLDGPTVGSVENLDLIKNIGNKMRERIKER